MSYHLSNSGSRPFRGYTAERDLQMPHGQPTATAPAIKQQQACAVLVSGEEGVTKKKWSEACPTLSAFHSRNRPCQASRVPSSSVLVVDA